MSDTLHHTRAGGGARPGVEVGVVRGVVEHGRVGVRRGGGGGGRGGGGVALLLQARLRHAQRRRRREAAGAAAKEREDSDSISLKVKTMHSQKLVYFSQHSRTPMKCRGHH